MNNTRRQFKSREKVKILRLHLLEHKAISDTIPRVTERSNDGIRVSNVSVFVRRHP